MLEKYSYISEITSSKTRTKGIKFVLCNALHILLVQTIRNLRNLQGKTLRKKIRMQKKRILNKRILLKPIRRNLIFESTFRK